MGVEVSEVINILRERYDRVFQGVVQLSSIPRRDFADLQFMS